MRPSEFDTDPGSGDLEKKNGDLEIEIWKLRSGN